MTRTYQSLICAKNLSFIAQWHTFLADVLGKFHCAKSSTADHVGAGFLLSMRNQRRTSPPKQPAKDPKLHVQRNKPQKIWDSPFHTCKRWPDIVLCSFFAHLWTLSASSSVHKQEKKNEADIRPANTEQAWSINHIIRPKTVSDCSLISYLIIYQENPQL